jgi:hypothetical protein
VGSGAAKKTRKHEAGRIVAEVNNGSATTRRVALNFSSGTSDFIEGPKNWYPFRLRGTFVSLEEFAS